MRAAIKREKPDLIVFTGELTDPANVAHREGAAVGRRRGRSGSPTVVDPAHIERLRAIGFVEVYAKPVNLDEVLGGLRRHARARRLQQRHRA